MPTLLELQTAVREFMLRGDAAAAEHVIADGIAPEGRLSIYRNTYVSVVVNALRLAYPAVHRLVGGEFFEGAARTFIDANPPRAAYLNAYGAEFGDFLATFAPASSLAYLPDVARLDWAVNVALHADDAAPLDVQRLANMPEDIVFVPHPSVSLLETRFPADAIWRAAIDDNDEALSAIELDDRPVRLIVSRDANGVEVQRLDTGAWHFAKALISGVPLPDALASAEADMSAALAAHLANGHFIDALPSQERTGS